MGYGPLRWRQNGFHGRYRELAVQAPCFPHPIRRLRRHLPRFAEKGGARRQPVASMICVNLAGRTRGLKPEVEVGR
jgi:hypothetical protein